MGVKRDNLELISGLLLASFILNYMVIRVKQRDFERGEIKKKKKGERARGREERRGKRKDLESRLLDHHSSVEVGYGFYAFRSKLLIANDMYWVVL